PREMRRHRRRRGARRSCAARNNASADARAVDQVGDRAASKGRRMNLEQATRKAAQRPPEGKKAAERLRDRAQAVVNDPTPKNFGELDAAFRALTTTRNGANGNGAEQLDAASQGSWPPWLRFDEVQVQP